MADVGGITDEALVCEHGQKSWNKVMPLIRKPTSRIYRENRRVRAGGSSCLAAVVFLIGLCMLISPLFLIGLAFILAAGLLQTRYVTQFFCGSCGNDVAATSDLCPTCHCDLEDKPETTQQKMTKIFWWMLYAVIFFCIGLMIVNGMAPK